MEANLQTLREKLEQARVIDELHTKKISNVHVFQPATFAERAVSPKKPILAAGFLLSWFDDGTRLIGHCVNRRRHIFVQTKTLKSSLVSRSYRIFLAYGGSSRSGWGIRRHYREKCQALIAEILLSPGRTGQTRWPFDRDHRGQYRCGCQHTRCQLGDVKQC